MILPSMEQFNGWYDKDKFWYVEHSLEGIQTLAGIPGFLFRPEYSIRFHQNRKSKVISAEGIPLKEGLEQVDRVIIAAKSLKNVN